VRFLYCTVCFNVLIQFLAAIVNKWCVYYKDKKKHDREQAVALASDPATVNAPHDVEQRIIIVK